MTECVCVYECMSAYVCMHVRWCREESVTAAVVKEREGDQEETEMVVSAEAEDGREEGRGGGRVEKRIHRISSSLLCIEQGCNVEAEVDVLMVMNSFCCTDVVLMPHLDLVIIAKMNQERFREGL